MNKDKIIQILDEHFNNYWNSTTDLIKETIAEEILALLTDQSDD